MRTAVITGASRGLGLAIAKEFAANGWRVVGTGRSAKPAEFPQDAEYRRFDTSDLAAFVRQQAENHRRVT